MSNKVIALAAAVIATLSVDVPARADTTGCDNRSGVSGPMASRGEWRKSCLVQGSFTKSHKCSESGVFD